MVLQRKAKKSELEFSVECGSWTENSMWFSSPNTYFKYMKTCLKKSTRRHTYSENVCICTQTICVCIGQKRNLTPCQSSIYIYYILLLKQDLLFVVMVRPRTIPLPPTGSGSGEILNPNQTCIDIIYGF